MPEANWDVFSQLPGAADRNFEKLCRALVRRHYGRFGHFKELANQAGVEFHLQLTETCDLGSPPQWIGWQCKWYQLASGQNLGTTRRDNIVEGIEKTRKYVPGVTDWKLWTRHTLTKSDQTWFYGLSSQFPELKLDLLTANDLEELLAGPGAMLRETYFGELVLTPTVIEEQYRLAVAPFRRQYQPEVHLVVGAEEHILRCLGGRNAWESLTELSSALRKNSADIASLTEQLQAKLKSEVDSLLVRATESADLLDSLYTALGAGDFEALRQLLATNPSRPVRYERLLSKLRGARTDGAPLSANLVADIHAVASQLGKLEKSIGVRAVAILAAAGEGKSELAVKVTQPNNEFPGGVLLLGKDLHAGQGLDDLLSAFKVSGKSAESFERLVEAVDAAGQRAGRRLPIVIDGLNEAEDPRDWKDELARADELLKAFPHALLVVTLRNEFAQMCLPEDFPKVKHNGFQENPQAAIDKYFAFYKIDAIDAELPLEFLQHPLTLRIYCEVANARRQHIVGVEALPNSLATLFDEHVKRVAARVAELSSTAHRVYQEEVHEALVTIAGLLWDNNARSAGFKAARTAIGDVGSWDVSIVRALESEGVLVRTTSEVGSQGIAFSYDLMAGHLLAKYLLTKPSLAEWIQSEEGRKKFNFYKPESHTFAPDVFRALVGLYPRHMKRRHLWQDVPEELTLTALLLTAESDPAHIGRETVERFAQEMQASKKFAYAAFMKLRSTRAAHAHPFDVDFLHRVLVGMTNTKRDLFWSEWVRDQSREIEEDLKFLMARWESGSLNEREVRRARWVMWTLTSTSRYLRDLATKALYGFAIKRPAEYFSLAVEAIHIRDLYVPERAFAAGYGAALSTWSDESAKEMREALPKLAGEILRTMFMPSATHPTCHALYRQYCLGIVALARMVDANCVSSDDAVYLVPPFAHLPSPFEQLPHYEGAAIDQADRAAISMDFGNYTMGRLVPDRSNYDHKHPEYIKVRSAIVARMLSLGYDPEQFEAIDRQMGSGPRMGGDKHKVDRYGKKYGWIAYFEMWGLRHAQDLLDESRSARPSDVDIDPTFPPVARNIELPFPELFTAQPKNIGDWITKGLQPDYRSLLERAEIDGEAGPWVLLDGFLEQNAPEDDRQLFTFLRGVFVESGEVERLCKLFHGLEYPGNHAIPAEQGRYYTYAGEMPFSTMPGATASTESDEEDGECMVSSERSSKDGVPVEIPVQEYRWESYHSVVNPASGVILPSTQLCEFLGLSYRINQWDLHDKNGVASMYRETGKDDPQTNGWLCYLRGDLLDRYLQASGKSLVWLMWGERGLHYRAAKSHNLHEYYANHPHIHKRSHVYRSASSV